LVVLFGAVTLRIESLEYNDEDYSDSLLSRLRGNIFHVTSQQAFEQIKREGMVLHNKDGNLPNSYNNSFGSKHGWVCLFDFMDIDDGTVDITLRNFNLFSPQGCEVCAPDNSEYERNLVYLLIGRKFFCKLVPNHVGVEIWNKEGVPYTRIIERTECWYPDNLPIEYIDKALLVNIRGPVSPLGRGFI
jgi:hypothetical protein